MSFIDSLNGILSQIVDFTQILRIIRLFLEFLGAGF